MIISASFPVLLPYFFFAYVIKLANSTREVLNDSVSGGQSCVVPDFNGIFSSPPLTMRLPLELSMFNVHMAFIGLYNE
jgi:hypothetical protein